MMKALIAALLLSFCCTAVGVAAPNLVVILADDQGWGDLSVHGNRNLKTPHIDSLARDGALFERFFVCPVCSPTRAEFLTGRYHVRGGVYSTSTGGERLDLDERTIAEAFKAAGYKTAAFGKWHNGLQWPYHPNARGFDEYYGFCSGHWGHYFSPELEHNGKLVRGKGYVADDFTNHAIQFIEKNKSQPFFCYLPFCTPHSPMQVPDRFYKKFDGANLKLRNRDPQKENLAHTRAALAMVENIDWNVGRVLKKLDDLKLAENTIVVYFSDNGPNGWRWNGDMRGRKGSTDEGGVRSPLLIRWPANIARGMRVKVIAAAIDLLPTLADLCGIKRVGTKPLDGISLKYALIPKMRARITPQRMIFSHWAGRVSVRTQRFRLDNAGRLYEMDKDPGQRTDVSRTHPEIAAKMRKAVAKWRREVLVELDRTKKRPFTVGYSEITPLPARDGVPHGNVKRSARAPNCSFFTNWTSTNDRITWDVEVGTAGKYEATLYYTCPKDSVGSAIELSLGDARVRTTIATAHDPPLYGMKEDRSDRGSESFVKDFKPLRMGVIELKKGRGALALQALKVPGKLVADVRYVVLKRLKSAPAADAPGSPRVLKVLRDGLRSNEFWPSIHAAEALTLAGRGGEVRRLLEPKLKTEADDQKRCGIARELVRAGDVFRDRVMLDILAGRKSHGHVHAAESLFKVGRIGNGKWTRKRFVESQDGPLKIMSAAALGKCGNPRAMTYLRKTLGHSDMQIARIAAWVLARIGDKTDIPRLTANRKRATDDLTRAYFDNALALLGDAAGRKRVLKNLHHKNAAVRTYAAVFAGEAGLKTASKRLTELLDDSTLDVRIRAAQALVELSKPPSRREGNFSVDVFPATKTNPRYSEGSILELADGSLLFANTEFIGSGSDFAKAQIIAKRSTDGGRTWSKPRVLQQNVGGRNVMSVTLRRLPSRSAKFISHEKASVRNELRTTIATRPIGMFYLVKNSFSDLHVFLRVSTDEGKSFGKAVRVTTTPGYHVLNNDRVTVLSSGRILVPVATTADVRKVNKFASTCFLSDDGGETWRPGKGKVGYARRGAMEPEVIELNDGRVLMIIRTQLGHIAAAYSKDGGDTWSKPADWGVKAPEAPATLRRIPSTGDLLLVWNNTFRKGAGHGGKRTPLTAAISSDEGQTWRHVRNIETRPDQTYAYISLTFVGPRAVLSYYVSDEKTGRISTRFRSLPVRWFYPNQ